MKKKLTLLFIFFVAVTALCLFAGCGGDEGRGEDGTYYEVLLLNGEGFFVEENIVRVKKGGDAVFNVSLDERYVFFDLAGGEYAAGKYTVKNVLYERTVTITTKKITEINFLISHGTVNLAESPTDKPLLVGDRVEIIVTADENYNINSVSQNGEILDIEISEYRYAAFTITLQEVNKIDCEILGDAYNFTLNYNDNVGVVRYEKQEVYRYGDEIFFFAQPNSGYTFNYWDLNGSILTEHDEIKITITNHTNLKVSFYSANSIRIVYDENGGEAIQPIVPLVGEIGESVYLDNAYNKLHREKYSLVGFANEKNALGGGYIEHSLGAMISLSDRYQKLYAVWERWTEKEMFDYEFNAERTECVIRGLSENGKNAKISKLVIPGQIDGIPVTVIKSHAFDDDETIVEVVVGNSIVEIQALAFYGMRKLHAITMFDNMQYFAPNSIVENPELDVLKVNSATRRIYENEIETSYVDKMMRLKTSNKKKIVTISGCALARGLDAAVILQDRKFEDYDFINMGVHAGYGLYHLLDTIHSYINSGDIVIYAPELRDDMFGNETGWANWYIWRYLESNYDLLREFSIKNSYNRTNILTSFTTFIANKKMDQDVQISPSINRFNSVDQYGYFTYYRANSIEIGFEFDENALGVFAKKELIGKGIDEVNAFAREIQSRGAKIYYTYPPVYRYKDYDNPMRVQERAEFETAIADALIFPVLGRVADFAYGPEYLYESVSHCSTSGVAVYTADFKGVLEKQLIKEGIL